MTEEAYRLDILESAVNHVEGGAFDVALILLNRFFECTPDWRHPTEATGTERELWERLVAGTNAGRQRLIEFGEDVPGMSDETLQHYLWRLRIFDSWRKTLFKEQEK